MAVVRKQDGVQAQARKWRALVLPERGGGRDRIVEGYLQRVVPGLDEGFTCVPVDANRRFAGPVLPGGR